MDKILLSGVCFKAQSRTNNKTCLHFGGWFYFALNKSQNEIQHMLCSPWKLFLSYFYQLSLAILYKIAPKIWILKYYAVFSGQYWLNTTVWYQKPVIFFKLFISRPQNLCYTQQGLSPAPTLNPNTTNSTAKSLLYLTAMKLTVTPNQTQTCYKTKTLLTQ